MKLSGRGPFLSSAWLALALWGVAGSAQTTQFPASTGVGHASTPVSITIRIVTAGTASTPVALTQGLANADFAVAAGGTCAAGVAYSAGQQCTANVVFQPAYPGMRSGAVVLQDSAGTLLGAALVSGLATGSLPVFAPGRIDTVAGDAYWLYQGDGDAATSSPIFLPTGIVTDAAGNLYLSDSQNYRIRRVDAQTGIMTTIGGTGTPGYLGDNVPATQTMVSTPAGLAIDGAGNLYLADVDNHIVRRIDAFSGIITTVAGTPTTQGYTGDGGAATQATLSFPEAVALDAAGNLLIADTGNNVIRRVDAVTGKISTVAGTGVAGFSGDTQAATGAQLNAPWSVTVAQDGSLYVADLNNNRIRRVSPSGIMSTVAGDGQDQFGGDGSAAVSANLSEPTDVILDPAGNLYIADSGNDRVREVSGATGIIETICGDGRQQFAGDAGPANLAILYGPSALYADSGGNLFVADMFHNRVRRISALATALLYPTMKVGKLSAPQPVLLANDGNAAFNLTQPLLANAEEDAATTTCTDSTPVPSAGTCNIGAVFAPTVTGDPVTGSITVKSDSVYAAPVISLSGEVLSIQPTTVSVTSSVNPSLVGTSVTFTAAVTNGITPLSGSIVFLDGTTQLCNVAVTNSGASCSISTLALGPHSITANYSGDPNNAASVSPTLTQVVKQAATLNLTVTPNPSIVTASVTMSLSSTAPSGNISGTVSFYDGATALTAATLSSSGTASYATTALSPGPHSLSVHYAGDALDMPAQSNAVSEVVQQASTTTTLFSSAATAIAGTQVTFTAVVFSANGPTPAGSVVFSAGTATLGTSTVGSDGNATLSLSSLAPGTYSVVAKYSGDTDDQTSTSAALTEIVQQIATATTLSASSNPVSAGSSLTLTATVSGATTGGGALTGKVSFHEGATTYGTAAVNASGVATLVLSTLPAGSHTLVASFAGDTDYAPSNSAGLVETVNSTSTSIVLTSPSATTIAGETAEFTATVSSNTGTPSGNIVFSDGGASFGQAQLNSQGVATLSTTTLTVGAHTITAVYNGDGSYNPSASAGLQHAVALATTALSLAGPSGTLEAGKAFAMKATLTSNGVNPTGALTLRDGSATIGIQTVAADGTFTFSGLVLGVGSHTLTAAYAGDTDDAATTSPAVSVIVQLATTTTSLSTSATPSTLGQSVTFTAAVSSDSPNITGSVQFMDGSSLLGSSPLSANGVATLSTSTLTFGAHGVSAVYSGDANHATSISPALTEQIVQAASAAISSSANPSNAGASVTFSVHITGSGPTPPTGTVVFRDGSNTIGTASLDSSGSTTMQTAALAVGSHTISASYGGDGNYSTASASLAQTVQSATTQVALAASANPATYAAPVTLTATVTGNGGVATGTVNFTDGGTTIGSSPLNANGVASLTSSSLAPGSHSIVANYPGSSATNASSSTPLTLSVKQTTGLDLGSNADPTSTLSAFALTATVINNGAGQATGTITFMDGSTQLGTAPLDSTGKATFAVTSMTAGSHALVASYAGDTENFAGTSPVLAEVIQLRPTTITVTGSATDPSNPQQITLIAVVHWSGPVPATGNVTFSSGASTLGSSPIDPTGVATLNFTPQTQSESVIATYEGDVSYAGSTSGPEIITTPPPTQFTLHIDPPSVTFPSKQHSTVNLDLASLSGFADTLQLGCLGLPYAATCTFSSPQVKLAANGTVSAQLTIDTGDPLGAGASASRKSSDSTGVMLCLLPCLLGLTFGARRRRFSAASVLLLLIATAMTVSATGCSGLHVNGTPPGTYTFKVTASGMNTGTTISQTMTLTVTQ